MSAAFVVHVCWEKLYRDDVGKMTELRAKSRSLDRTLRRRAKAASSSSTELAGVADDIDRRVERFKSRSDRAASCVPQAICNMHQAVHG